MAEVHKACLALRLEQENQEKPFCAEKPSQTLNGKESVVACPSSGFCTEYEIVVISVWGKGRELRVILSEHR